MRDLSFRREIAGLRALAVASVVIFHAARGVLPGGFVGVDIFFVISGYLISRILFAEAADEGICLFDFYAKRIRRIFPALILMLACVWLAGWALLDPFEFTELGKELKDGAVFILNFRFMRESGYFDLNANSKILLHLWSLSIEEQFYLIWPLLLIVLAPLQRAQKTLFGWLLAGLFAASLAWCVIETSANPTRAFFLPTTRAFELLLGAMVAWREQTRAFIWRNVAWQNVAVGAGLALMAGSILFIDESQAFPGWRAIAPAAGCALVLASPGAGVAAWPLRTVAARLVGDISYPLYLWHWPLLAFANVRLPGGGGVPLRLALMALATVLAFLTWRFVERNAGRLFAARRLPALAALAASLAAVGVIGAVSVTRQGFPERFPPEIADIFRFRLSGEIKSVAIAPPCFDALADAPLFETYDRASVIAGARRGGCLAQIGRDRPTIAVIGDSHAEHLIYGLASEFGDTANVVDLHAKYCAPLVTDIEIGRGRSATKRCAIINQTRPELVREMGAEIVVVGAYFLSYLDDPVWRYPDFLSHFLDGLAELRKAGVKKIIVVGEVPTWSPSAPGLVARALEAGTDAARSRDGLKPESVALDAKLKALPWPEGVRYVSLADALCSEAGCLRRVGDTLPDDIIAFDYGHFSARGSAYVAHEIIGPHIRDSLAAAER